MKIGENVKHNLKVEKAYKMVWASRLEKVISYEKWLSISTLKRQVLLQHPNNLSHQICTTPSRLRCMPLASVDLFQPLVSMGLFAGERRRLGLNEHVGASSISSRITKCSPFKWNWTWRERDVWRGVWWKLSGSPISFDSSAFLELAICVWRSFALQYIDLPRPSKVSVGIQSLCFFKIDVCHHTFTVLPSSNIAFYNPPSEHNIQTVGFDDVFCLVSLIDPLETMIDIRREYPLFSAVVYIGRAVLDAFEYEERKCYVGVPSHVAIDPYVRPHRRVFRTLLLDINPRTIVIWVKRTVADGSKPPRCWSAGTLCRSMHKFNSINCAQSAGELTPWWSPSGGQRWLYSLWNSCHFWISAKNDRYYLERQRFLCDFI